MDQWHVGTHESVDVMRLPWTRAKIDVQVPDPVEDAARKWLTRFVDMYEGMDTGVGDPIHVARLKAQEFLEAGPTGSDPFVIAGLISQALPGDDHAKSLATSWTEQYVRAMRTSR